MPSGLQTLRPATPLRSPLPLLATGIAVAALLILLVAVPARQGQLEVGSLQTLSEREALAIVAGAARSGEAAMLISAQGQAQYDDGSWIVSVGEARFRFSERNRVVMPENDAARRLHYAESLR